MQISRNYSGHGGHGGDAEINLGAEQDECHSGGGDGEGRSLREDVSQIHEVEKILGGQAEGDDQHQQGEQRS